MAPLAALPNRYYHNDVSSHLLRAVLMLPYDFEESIGYWLVGAHNAYLSAVQRELAPHGITLRQAQVLGWLAAAGPLSQRDLAERMLIEPPNLVGVLDRMEQAGLVERRACDEDRRKKWVHPLPAAQETWRKIATCGRRVRKQAVEGLSATDAQQLRDLLNRVRENLSSTPAVR